MRRCGAFPALLFWVVTCVAFLGRQTLLRADTVTLNSGDVLEGQITSETDTQLEMEASFYNGTIISKREVLKSDIKSIARESIEQKQEKAAYAALSRYMLNPNQEFTKAQYATGISVFEKFLTTYTNSTFTAEVNKHLVDWRAESANVESGKVKFAATWMTPDEKKVRVEKAQKQADLQAAQTAVVSLQKQLADLQTQRGTLAASVADTQAKIKAIQDRLAAVQGGPGPGPSSGRSDLAGRLTAKVTGAQSQTEITASGAPNPEIPGLQSQLASYQREIAQEQGTLSSVDAQIQSIQSQIPQREQDSKAALARLTETTQDKTNTPVKPVAPPPPPPPPPEPPPPWYMRLWKSIHG
jgi:DNA repair exonuclease SbcCD ATPase subunit